MIGGMRKFVLLYPDGIRIQTLEEYREYCYYVAGTVGYLLTDLWREHVPSIGAARYGVLREQVARVRRGAADGEHPQGRRPRRGAENSIYIPEQLLRAHGSSHAAHPRPGARARRSAPRSRAGAARLDDLEQARGVSAPIPRRAVAIRLSCVLPLLFAYATLRDLTRTPGRSRGGRR